MSPQGGVNPSSPFTLNTFLCAEPGREDLLEFRHRGVYFGVGKSPGSILHNYPKRKAFSAFGEIIPAAKVEQPDLAYQGRAGRGEGV